MSLTSDSEDQPTYSTDSRTSEESASSSSGDSSSNDDPSTLAVPPVYGIYRLTTVGYGLLIR